MGSEIISVDSYRTVKAIRPTEEDHGGHDLRSYLSLVSIRIQESSRIEKKLIEADQYTRCMALQFRQQRGQAPIKSLVQALPVIPWNRGAVADLRHLFF